MPKKGRLLSLLSPAAYHAGAPHNAALAHRCADAHRTRQPVSLPPAAALQRVAFSLSPTAACALARQRAARCKQIARWHGTASMYGGAQNVGIVQQGGHPSAQKRQAHRSVLFFQRRKSSNLLSCIGCNSLTMKTKTIRPAMLSMHFVAWRGSSGHRQTWCTPVPMGRSLVSLQAS